MFGMFALGGIPEVFFYSFVEVLHIFQEYGWIYLHQNCVFETICLFALQNWVQFIFSVSLGAVVCSKCEQLFLLIV